MDSLWVDSKDGTKIYVEDGGRKEGPAIIFVHGLSHSHYVWKKQMESGLREKYRLISYDLRGHGLSDRPREGYEKGENWANDLYAVISKLRLERFYLVGWSFGGMIISDYIRYYGQQSIAGIVLTNASTRLGVPGRENDIGADYKALGEGLASSALQEGIAALSSFVRLCVYREHTLESFYTFLGLNVSVSPFARKGILERKVQNDDILRDLKMPVLLIHGNEDQIVLKCVAERHAALIPDVCAQYYENTGHCAFWEQAERFCADLERFLTMHHERKVRI